MPLPFSRRASQTAPSFSRDFAGLKTLDHGVGPAITFTRASNATFFDASGVLQTASNDTPRFDHDPATAGNPSRGLLIEEARTNLLERSAELDNAYWTKHASVTVTANADTAPDGTTTADRVVFTADSQDVRRDVTTSAGTYTGSYYVKAGVAGEVGNTIAIGIGDPSYTDKLITLTNSWQRIDASKTTNTGTCRIGVHTYAAATARNVLVWGFQLEAGAFATSYIPTTSAAATRAADSAVVTPISSFYNQAEGTLFAEFSRPQTANVADYLQFAGSSPEQIVLETNGTAPSTSQRLLVEPVGGATANISFSTVAANTVYRLIGAYKTDSFQAAQNGTLGTEDTSGALPSVSQMNIGAGQYVSGSVFKIINGHIRKIAYWPKRLTDTLLQQLTT